MSCPSCRAPNPPDAAFCEDCGTRLERVCRSCGAGITPGKQFCRSCGAATGDARSGLDRISSSLPYTPKHLVERILTSRSALEGERKQVTVLFCDIVGSTELATQIGAEAMHRSLDAFFGLALKTVHRYEGTINQFLGDGFMALFGAPLAHEDHARRAVLAALDFQRELEERTAPFPVDVRISTRIGLNTGSVVVGKIGDDLRMDYTAIGDTVNVAARLQQAAIPGKILLSDHTYRAASAYVDCHSLPAIQAKGKADPIAVYEPYRVRAGAEVRQQRLRAHALPFVGRDDQLNILNQSFARVLDGCGGAVLVVGEPGLGKSRLLAEGRQCAMAMPLQWFEGSALSFGRSLSYWPFLEIVRACAGIDQADEEEQSWAKLEQKVAALFPETEVAEILPYLGTMLALTVPEQYQDRVKYLDGLAMGHQISRSSRRLFERVALDKPTVLVFEDWHWADESSITLLEHLLPLHATAPVLFCVATRPDPQGNLGKVRSAMQKLDVPYRELTLAPLAVDQATALARFLVGPGTVSPQLRDVLLERTGGNPFFLEELVKSLQEIGALVRDSTTGQWRMSAGFDHAALPSTIEGVLLARIDRLGDGLKQVLRTASVIGRAFFYRVLRAIAQSDVDLEERVTALRAIELIDENRQFPELEYVFKHVLVQQVAYDSILTERRSILHQQVGRCLEQMFSDRVEEFYPVIAYHYAKAEDWEKAQEYLFKAGDQAGRIAADAEALEHYRKAVASYDQQFEGKWDPIQRASIDRKIGEALFRTGQHDHAHAYLERSAQHLGRPYPTSRRALVVAVIAELMREGRDSFIQRLAPFEKQPSTLTARSMELCRIWNAMVWIDYFLDGERLFLDALLLKREARSDPHSAEFLTGLAYTALVFDVLGSYKVAGRYQQHALRYAIQTEHALATGYCYHVRGMHDYPLGEWDAALSNCNEAASIYWSTGNLRSWGGATCCAWNVLRAKGDAERAVLAKELLRVASETHDQQLQGWARSIAGVEHMYHGAYDAAIGDFEKGAQLLELVPDYLILALTLAYMASSHLKAGNLPAALSSVERSAEIIKQHRLKGFWISRSIMVRAEVYLGAAEQCSEEEREIRLRAAAKACRAAAKFGKTVRDDSVPDSLRLCGIYAWITGARGKAQRLWEKGRVAAEELGAKYVLAQMHFEIGRRLHSRSHLRLAEGLFRETGAQADLLLTQRYLVDSV